MDKVRGNEEDRELCSLSENVPWKPLNPYSILSMRLQSPSLVKALSQLNFSDTHREMERKILFLVSSMVTKNSIFTPSTRFIS